MWSLHPKFDYVDPTIEEAHDLEEMLIHKLMGSRHVYEKHM